MNTELEYGRPGSIGGVMPADGAARLQRIRIDDLRYHFAYGSAGAAADDAPIAMALDVASARNERLAGEATLERDGHAVAEADRGRFEAVIVPRSPRSEAEWRATIDPVECLLRITVPRDVFDALAEMVRARVPAAVKGTLSTGPAPLAAPVGDVGDDGSGWAAGTAPDVGETVHGEVLGFAFGQDADPIGGPKRGFWTKAIFAFVVVVIVYGLVAGQSGL